MTDSAPLIGQVISHYRIVEKIGAGGMGEVYRARDERLKRDVAFKILPPESQSGADAERKLLREARSASRRDCTSPSCNTRRKCAKWPRVTETRRRGVLLLFWAIAS